MNSLRIARTALRVRPAAMKAPLQRRGYAEAVSDKVDNSEQIVRNLLTFPQIKLSLALPHQVRSELDNGTMGISGKLGEGGLGDNELEKRGLYMGNEANKGINSRSTSRRMSSKSTFPRNPARWVFSQTTFLQLSS